MEQEKLYQLMNSLTLKEKIGQLIQLSGDFFGNDNISTGPIEELGIDNEMIQYTGSILNVSGAKNTIKIQKEYLAQSRHKIPLLFMNDVVYGYRTILPIPLGQGATWNPNLIRNGYEHISKEASKAGVHVTFSPMVDLVRDPRWGRCLESTGEDPYLNSQFAKAVVEGFQGDLNHNQLASCVKHFAAYGAAEAGRDYNTVDMSERRLRQDYLPAYHAALEAGAKMVMTSFNTIDGIPATANKWLMKDILRDEWGFDGVLITDYAAIKELIAHGVAVDDAHASQLALEAGVDIDMKTACYANQLQPLLKEGRISLELIDQAVWRVLTLKNDLGLFENPYRGADLNEENYMRTSDAREIALQASREALVLLKNNNNLLPLDFKTQKIAFIGPYVDSKFLTGLWAINGKTEEIASIKDVVISMDAPHVTFTKGCDYLDDYSKLGKFGEFVSNFKINTDDEIKKDLQEAIIIAKESDIIVLALGEHMLESGEAGSRTQLGLPEIQQCLLNEISQLGKPIVLVLFNGRPLVLTEIENKVDAILEAWFPGSEGAQAIVDILNGTYNPSGRLSMSFPYTVGQIPIYYNSFNTGRPVAVHDDNNRFASQFLDAPNTPLYPFGFGLSYSQFSYNNLKLSSNILSIGSPITISVNITNTSSIAGTETVQLYVRDLVSSVVRPVKELINFEKIFLKGGECKTVTFILTEKDLRFINKDMFYQFEEGVFQIFVGHSSQEYLSSQFTLIKH
ncbi:beta-glucosidase BglX [Streptococcus sp. S784/96/1]|uniref:beta-glucosidase BglX n=1 Tax=Streptococcus sp. S784/96/1 TaxID=2653499 RepID=UPI001389B214|nr:beta-glucosidase BglX [Streptococcus sp. S784/96/1]